VGDLVDMLALDACFCSTQTPTVASGFCGAWRGVDLVYFLLFVGLVRNTSIVLHMITSYCLILIIVIPGQFCRNIDSVWPGPATKQWCMVLLGSNTRVAR
jgi:hypothetical protein